MNNTTTEHQTYINGCKIAFREAGRGNPVIFLHGIPTNNHLWRNIMPVLAEHHRVIAPDLMNYGQSGKPSSADVSINAQSRMIVDLMDALGLRRADIVAHDIGGGVAQLIAVNYPEKVRRLVLIDSVCFDSWPIPEFEPLQKPEAEVEMSLEDFVSMMRDFMPNGVQRKSAMSDAVMDLYLEPWSSEEGKRAFFRNLRRLNPEYTQAIASELGNLPHKTLVLWGDKDPFQNPDYAKKLVEAIPKAELQWIEDAGHWLMEEKPEEIAAQLVRFLN